ncbi:MAG: hypothetical protein PHH77_10955 [Victivallaceae bacterium]|nr:hypothetical protein [Victivallaceae bacterium]
MTIHFGRTTYENMRYPGDDLEHWNGEEYLVEDFNSHIEFENGLVYDFFIDKMLTDGLSVPSAFQDRIERYGWYLLGGLEHDGLYAGEIFPRSLCDWIFLEKMEYKDLSRPTWLSRRTGAVLRNAAWLAVKAGGGFVWSGHEKEKVCAFRELAWLKINECPDEKLLERVLKHENQMIENGYPPVIKLAFNEAII